MVAMGFFRKVTLSFLIQGHMHEDVDQLFSGLSRKYYRSKIWSLKHMLDTVPLAYPGEVSQPHPIFNNISINLRNKIFSVFFT